MHLAAMVEPILYSVGAVSEILQHEGGKHSVLVLVVQFAKRPTEPLADVGLGHFNRQASLAASELGEGG